MTSAIADVNTVSQLVVTQVATASTAGVRSWWSRRCPSGRCSRRYVNAKASISVAAGTVTATARGPVSR
ncbi:hypothetical protein ACIHAX_32365 [Nocardia sp. NPDC051929]|uniref:hypothetical protein n=1 Tax=unclassified Nocardia TaxID=2637762 RepID=UPI0034278C02